MVKRAGWSSRGSGFNSQYPQPPVTPVPVIWCLLLASVGIVHTRYTDIHKIKQMQCKKQKIGSMVSYSLDTCLTNSVINNHWDQPASQELLCPEKGKKWVLDNMSWNLFIYLVFLR